MEMQVLVLTDKVSGSLIYIFPAQLKALEDIAGGGTHLIFGGDMGRQVVESKEQIFQALGLAPLKVG